MMPRVFFVVGPAGSGKSTVSRQLARRYAAAYLDKDTVATLFTELLLEQNGSDKNDRDHNAFYQSTILPLEYDAAPALPRQPRRRAFRHTGCFWAAATAAPCEWSGATHILLDNSANTLSLDGVDEALLLSMTP